MRYGTSTTILQILFKEYLIKREGLFLQAYYVTHTLYGITVDRGGVPNIVASGCMIDFFFFF